VKGKVISFKKKNGNWKRARMKLAVTIAGNIYDNQCVFLTGVNLRNPISGYKNRKQLKMAKHDGPLPFITWKTKPGQLASAFDAQNVATGGVSF
jgi:hypothetical protein